MNIGQFNETLEMLRKAPHKVEVLKLVLAGQTNELELHLKPRTTETVSIKIPTEALESLKKVAANRDMTLEALLKFYIGQSLRQDLAKLFSERVLESTAQVLARHIESKEEILTIIQEIRAEATL